MSLEAAAAQAGPEHSETTFGNSMYHALSFCSDAKSNK